MAFTFKKAKVHGVPYGTCGVRKQVSTEPGEEPIWIPIHNAADKNTKRMADQISRGTDRTKSNTNESGMRAGARDFDANRMYASIPWDEYDNALDLSSETIQIALNEAGAAMLLHLPAEYRKFTFDSTTPRAINWAKDQGARLVVEVGDETKAAIRTEIDKALKEGLGADRTAKNVINLIGLTRRQAAAVTNYRKLLEASGASEKAIERDTKKYSKRLHEYRAGNIARTELMNAANQGHLEMLQQGVEQNLIPPDAYKVWIVTSDDRLCKYCKPMDEQKQPLDGQFTSEKGNVDRPPLHPMCRCVMGVEFEK
jgi:hypothetical protein